MPSSQNAGLLFKYFRISKKLSLLAGSVTNNAGTANFTGTVVLPVGTKPATCTVGQIMADSADSNKLYECTATNTWTKVGTQV